jgi:cell division protein FtsQ
MAQRSNPRRQNQPEREKSLRFMRKEAGKRPVKLRKKSKLTSKHIVLTFIFLGIFFFGVERVWTFLITWEQLNIKEVEIDCCHPLLNGQVKSRLGRMPLGNILLLDPSKISSSLKSLPRAAAVKVRKIFPSTLRVSVEERKPWALVKKQEVCLIDREGVVLQSSGEEVPGSLPLLLDHDGFKRDCQDKIEMAGEFLDGLSPAEREAVAFIDLGQRSNMIIGTGFPATLLYLGRNEQAERFKDYLEIKGRLGLYGSLEYVDMRFKDRIYIKIRPEANSAAVPPEQRR